MNRKETCFCSIFSFRSLLRCIHFCFSTLFKCRALLNFLAVTARQTLITGMFLTVEAISHCNKQAREAVCSLSFSIVKSSRNIFVENMLLSCRNTNQLKLEKKNAKLKKRCREGQFTLLMERRSCFTEREYKVGDSSVWRGEG